MNAPESFVERLESTFRGRLRIRWSTQFREWRIEQKVGRGLFPGFKPKKLGWDESVDKFIEHRDGYVFVMSVRTGDRMGCPRCQHELKVPFKETTHLQCPMCKLAGRPSWVAAVYFPLGDDLITHLKMIDPENAAREEIVADLDRQNDALSAAMEADALRPAEAAFEDDYRRIVGIPTAHLSGRTSFWK